MSEIFNINLFFLLEKLSNIQNDNKKILDKLQQIQKGKVLSVVPHQVSQINKQKTLNYEKKLKLHGTESLPPRRLRHGTEQQDIIGKF